MIKIHPDAAANFNQKAVQVLTFVRQIQTSAIQKESFEPELHPLFSVTSSDILDESLVRSTNFIGSTVAIYLDDKKSLGVFEDGCLEIQKLLDSLLKVKEINRKVSIKTLESLLHEWIKCKYYDRGFCEFIEYFCNSIIKLIDVNEVWIPIQLLHIEKNFNIGKVTFKPITKKVIDDLETHALNQAKDSQQEITKMLFDKKIRCFQGYTAATILIEAEPNRANEIALEETHTALAMLRVFSVAAQEPLIFYPCSVWGSSNIDYAHFISLKEGNLHQLSIKTLDRRPEPEILNIHTIDKLFSAGLNILDRLLRSQNISLFQEKLLDSLILYSRSTVSKNTSDKLVYILVSLESIFLRNSSEPIQQNLGERIAFLIGNSIDERKKIIRVIRDAYNLRSRFVHHGGSVDDYDKMREFMLYARRAVISVIHASESVPTIEVLLDELDDRKLS